MAKMQNFHKYISKFLLNSYKLISNKEFLNLSNTLRKNFHENFLKDFV